MNKKIAILGVTGSVGTQAQEVAASRSYTVELISARRDVSGAEASARRFLPRVCVMAEESAARDLRTRLADTSVEVLSGEEALLDAITASSAETVVNSILGEAGLMPSLSTVRAGKRLALANKESLVIAGDIVRAVARANHAEIIPVDSEHSAIFQSLLSGKRSEVNRLILTASGGPFFGKTKEELECVTLDDTLAHPTWRMGRKITVDSATLMNKGFEIIEAAHLFGIKPEKIDVVVHRESILHSAVEFVDRTVIGEFSIPDMRTCVQYAVDYPDRLFGDFEPLDLAKIGRLTFFEPDYEAFPLLSLAKRAFSDGGAMPAVVNAADEVAVERFLSGEISFAEISRLVISVYEKMTDARREHTIDGIISSDRRAREYAKEYKANL